MFKKCLLTGSNGYVGGVIKDHLSSRGWAIYELRRSVSDGSPENIIPYVLGEDIDPTVFKGVDVLIHCAYDFSISDRKKVWEVNVKGSLRLFELAKLSGVKKIVFISSMSAFEGCRSVYGQAKLEIEKWVLKAGHIAVRPGLVFGRRPGGIFKHLDKLVSYLRLTPLVNRGDQLQYVCLDSDLSVAIEKLMIDDNVSDIPIIAASSKSVTFKDIISILAQSKNRKVWFIYFPYSILLGLLRFFELINLNIGFRSDSLVGLVNHNPDPNFYGTIS
jgi:nucleoside-diphosphate-sugar epimerase